MVSRGGDVLQAWQGRRGVEPSSDLAWPGNTRCPLPLDLVAASAHDVPLPLGGQRGHSPPPAPAGDPAKRGPKG